MQLTLWFAAMLSTALGSADDEIRVSVALLKPIAEVEVPAGESGMLTALAVKEGQRVKRGQVLGAVDDEEVLIQLEQTEVELADAALLAQDETEIELMLKELEIAEAEHQRALDSADRFAKSVTESEIHRLQLLVEQSKLRVQQARRKHASAQHALALKQAETKLAKLKVTRRQLHSPLDGQVVQVYSQQGEWLQPGQSVVRVLNADRLKAEAFLPADDLPADLTGHPARLEFRRQGEPQTVSGQVTFVSPELNAVNGQVRIWAEFENKDGVLRPGMQVELVIQRSKLPQR